ncbi:hypothetical protein G7Y29_01950 [Corynebacterium qintianiae]|uniref:Uncharacterized protein n=1 Tax=Corynebacterium qintianiae TaxID=2709392 RepID=A0A7T0KMW9_9CORY|nr:hypothetical protein [Corynebacterium qintianiae]QPK83600.1 hypothetical protein G7Y29_01950 [Corynebacterium qintianiae]
MHPSLRTILPVIVGGFALGMSASIRSGLETEQAAVFYTFYGIAFVIALVLCFKASDFRTAVRDIACSVSLFGIAWIDLRYSWVLIISVSAIWLAVAFHESNRGAAGA